MLSHLVLVIPAQTRKPSSYERVWKSKPTRRTLNTAVEISHISATVSDTKTFPRRGVRRWAWGRFFACFINYRWRKMSLEIRYMCSFWSLLSLSGDHQATLKIHRQCVPQNFFLLFPLLLISRSLSFIENLFGLARIVKNFHGHEIYRIIVSLYLMVEQKLVLFEHVHIPPEPQEEVNFHYEKRKKAFQMWIFSWPSNDS